MYQEKLQDFKQQLQNLNSGKSNKGAEILAIKGTQLFLHKE